MLDSMKCWVIEQGYLKSIEWPCKSQKKPRIIHSVKVHRSKGSNYFGSQTWQAKPTPNFTGNIPSGPSKYFSERVKKYVLEIALVQNPFVIF